MINRKVIIINLILIVVIFTGFEIGLRVFAPNASFSERYVMNLGYEPSGYSRMWFRPNQTIYETDEGKVQKNKPKFHINNWGYRGEDFGLIKDSNEIRIAILGGSHVFDLNSLNYEGNYGFAKILEQKLNDLDYNCRVINGGVPGANTCDFPTKIHFDLSRYSIDYLIINSIWNDTKWISKMTDSTQLIRTGSSATKSRPNPFVKRVNFLDYALGWSIFYRKVRDFYWRKKLKTHLKGEVIEGVISNKDTLLTNFELGLTQYKKNIEASIKLAQQIGARPVLAIEERLVSRTNTEAEKETISYQMVNVKNHEELVSIFEGCDQILMDCATEFDLPLLNANQFMKGGLNYFKDHVHTTPLGSERIAEIYKDFFLSIFESSD